MAIRKNTRGNSYSFFNKKAGLWQKAGSKKDAQNAARRKSNGGNGG